MEEGAKLKLGWASISLAVSVIEYKIRHLYPKARFDRIVGIARGGLIPGVMLSHRLDLPFSMVSAKSYEGTEKQGSPVVTFGEDCEGIQHLLIVDDIIDTGDTQYVIENHFPHCLYAALVTKQTTRALYAMHVSPAQWVEFPWEVGAGG